MLKIGIDGGGTTTRAVVLEHDGQDIRVLGRAEAASSNHYGVGLDAAMKNIQTAISGALSAAGIAESAIESYGFGLAGACTPAEQALLSGRLATLVGDKPFVVDEDVVAAQSGAFAGGPGAVCIAGTGANCFGIDAKKQRARADGVGPLLGDRGGGYRIGEAALRAVCAASDGSRGSTSLVQPVLAAFGITTVDELVQIVYQPNFSRSRVAAIFPIVLQEEKNGDTVARELLVHAGCELAHTTLAVLTKLGLDRVAVVGGVFENSDVVRRHFQSELETYMTASAVGGVEIITPQYDAVIGAALLVRN